MSKTEVAERESVFFVHNVGNVVEVWYTHLGKFRMERTVCASEGQAKGVVRLRKAIFGL